MTYRRMLADGRDDGGLQVVVVPSARVSTIWSELLRHVDGAGSVAVEDPAPIGFTRLAKTNMGPSLALTTWRQVIETLQLELTHDPARLADVMQLRTLCDAADVDALAEVSVRGWERSFGRGWNTGEHLCAWCSRRVRGAESAGSRCCGIHRPPTD
jgi:hypothetical protein